MVLHWKHYFPNCPFSLERLQWAQGNVSNTLSLAVPQAMMGMLVWRLVENVIPTVEKFPEHNTLSLGCWVSVWGGVNLPQSPQIQTGSPADHRWKKHLSHRWMKLLLKCIPWLSWRGQWSWSGDLSHPDQQHHAGPFPFQRKTRQGKGGGHS